MSGSMEARMRLHDLEQILDNWVEDFGEDTKTVKRIAKLRKSPHEMADANECVRLFKVLKKCRRDFVKGIYLTIEKETQRARDEAAQRREGGNHDAP